MHRHVLPDREWNLLAPLLPSRSRTGRAPKDHRTIIDALLWLAKTGAPWRDLPERFGPWRTSNRRRAKRLRSILKGLSAATSGAADALHLRSPWWSRALPRVLPGFLPLR